jgi:hypothetical protein
VQYEVEVEDGEGEVSREIFYGKLELILECDIPDKKIWGKYLWGTMILLAVITPCITIGKDAAKESRLTTYQHTTTQIVTDLRAISAVVGRVQTRNRWGIVDRSQDSSRTEFIPSHMEVFNLPDEESE